MPEKLCLVGALAGDIIGSISKAWYWEVPQGILREVEIRMPNQLWKVVELFSEKK